MPTVAVDHGRIAQLEEAFAELNALSGMFMSGGWKLLTSKLEEQETRAKEKLLSTQGAKDLAEIYAQRERHSLIRFFLDLEANTSLGLEVIAAELSEMRQGDGDA